jgi:hypothetical protein
MHPSLGASTARLTQSDCEERYNRDHSTREREGPGTLDAWRARAEEEQRHETASARCRADDEGATAGGLVEASIKQRDRAECGKARDETHPRADSRRDE